MPAADRIPSTVAYVSQDFYGAYDAQEFATANAPELDMQTVPSLNIVSCAQSSVLCVAPVCAHCSHPLLLLLACLASLLTQHGGQGLCGS